jgi:hypothetical protein
MEGGQQTKMYVYILYELQSGQQMTFHFFHIRYIVILGLNLSPGAVFHKSEKQIMEAFLRILLCGLIQINHMHYVVAELVSLFISLPPTIFI